MNTLLITLANPGIYDPNSFWSPTVSFGLGLIVLAFVIPLGIAARLVMHLDYSKRADGVLWGVFASLVIVGFVVIVANPNSAKENYIDGVQDWLKTDHSVSSVSTADVQSLLDGDTVVLEIKGVPTSIVIEKDFDANELTVSVTQSQ